MTNFYTQMASTNAWETEVKVQGENVRLPKGILKVYISDEGTQIGKAKGATEKTHLVQKIEFTVAEGEFKNATHTIYLPIINPNEIAESISKSTLKSLSLAIGQYPKASLGELKNKAFKIKTDHKLGTYVDKEGLTKPSLNVEVKSYHAIDSEVPGEELPLITANDTWNSPAGLAFTAALIGNTAPSAQRLAPRPPSVPPAPVSVPKAPVQTTEVNVDDNRPAWLTPEV